MYNVILVHLPSDNRADRLRSAVSVETNQWNVPIRFLEFSQVAGVLETSAVVVYLGSSSAIQNAQCVNQIQRSLDLHLPIIPVVEDMAYRAQQIPEQLEYIKAISWPVGGDIPQELLSAVLEVLGIIEKDRRVFISYRQSDSANVAIQLHHALAGRRFKVFLDQFQMAAPQNVQERIDEALEDMAFVLLLQSPDMHNSHWVDWEITRALKSQLPVVVVKWTNVTADVTKIREANFPTVMFDPAIDLIADCIRQSKLGEILQSVERYHSEGLFRRRRESIIAAKLFAESEGWQVVEEPRWKLILTRRVGQRNPVLLAVTPRLARAEDVHELDDWPTPDLPVVGLTWRKLLLQAATELPQRRRRFLEWVIDRRNLAIGLGTNSLQHLL